VRPGQGPHLHADADRAAAAATIVDVRRQFIGDEVALGRATQPGDRAAGLRAGTALATSTGFRMRSIQYVPNVVVSGFVPSDTARSATVTVAGSGAPHGKLTFAPNGAVSGRLDGRKVSFHSPTRAASLSPGRGWSESVLRFPGLVR
jgi:hypothetical protein